MNLKAPGHCWIDEEKTRFTPDGLCVDKDDKPTMPKFKWDDEAEEAAQLVHRIMVEVETEFFAAFGSPLKGRAEYNVGPIWLH